MSDESRIDEIVGRWREARDRGDRVDRESVIAANADLAETLRARFAAIDVLDATLAAPRAARATHLRPVDTDRYAEFRVLGQGGMGIVYWALDTDLNRQVAFKVVRPDAGQSGDPTPTHPLLLAPPTADTPASQAFATLKARFLQEAWVTAGLEHPGIVPVYEVGRTAEGVPYYTMRFVRGSRTLASAMEEAKGRPIDERLALLEPFLKVCDTIRYAHAHGVIHRDLKPDNVALGEFGEVVVLDWGLAKMPDRPDAAVDSWQERIHEYRTAADLKTLASAMGTPGYMAPEAALGRVAEVDAKSDVYSLGAILFQILVGRLPYEFRSYGELAMKLMREDAPDAASIDATIPAELAAICAKALVRSRDERVESVDALAADIRAWLAERAADRELDALREQAKAAFEAAAGLIGDLRLHQLDRAASACDQVLARRAADAAATALRREIDALRAKGVEERASATRRTALRRVGVAALVFLVVAGAVVGKVLNDRRQETAEALARVEDEQRRTAEERDAKDSALQRAEGLRLAAQSAVLRSDPGLALALAVAGRTKNDSLAAQNGLIAAWQACREKWVKFEIPAEGAEFSADGRRLLLVAKTRDWPHARVFDADSGRELAHLGLGVQFVHLSPDGRRVLASDGEAQPVHVCDAETGRCLTEIVDADAEIRDAVFHPRRDVIVTLGMRDDGEEVMRERDLATGRTVRESPLPEACRLEFDSSGSTLFVCPSLSASAGNEDDDAVDARVLDAETWTEKLRFGAGAPAPLNLHVARAMSSDGRFVLTEAPDARLHVWSVDQRAEVCVFGGDATLGPDGTPAFGDRNQFAFARDGTRVLSVTSDGTAYVWNAVSGKTICTAGRQTGTPIGTACLSADGSLLAFTLDREGKLFSEHDDVFVRDVEGLEPDVRLAGHRDTVLMTAFDPVRRRLVSVAEDECPRLWELTAATRTGVFKGHSNGPIASVAVSPDGKLVATGGAGDLSLRVWSLADGRERLLLHRPPYGDRLGCTLTSLTFSPDGSRIVAWDSEGSLLAWDATTGDPVARNETFGGIGRRGRVWMDPPGTYFWTLWGAHFVSVNDEAPPTRECVRQPLTVLLGPGTFMINTRIPLPRSRDFCFDVSPDGGTIAAGGAEASLIDPATPSECRRLDGCPDGVRAIAFVDGGAGLVTSSRDGTLRVWDPKTCREVGRLGDKPRAVWSLDVDAPQKTLLARYDDGGFATFDIAGRTRLAEFAAGVAFEDVSLSPDGRFVSTVRSDGAVDLWDARGGKDIRTLRVDGERLLLARFTPDGSRIVTASTDGIARVCEVATGAEVSRFAGHRGGAVEDFALSDDGRRMLVSYKAGHPVRVFGTAEWNEEFASSDETGLLSADGRRAVLRGQTGPLLVDLADRRATRLPRLGGAPPRALSSDGRLVAFDRWNDGIEVLSTETGVSVMRTGWFGAQAYSPAVFDDAGARLTYWCGDRLFRTWDVATGGLLRVFGPGVRSQVELAPGGHRALLRGDTLRLWDCDADREIALADSDAITHNAVPYDGIHRFSADGRRLVVVGNEKRDIQPIAVFDATTGALLATLPQRAGEVDRTAFSRDGRRIAVAGRPGTIRIWDANAAAEIATWTCASPGHMEFSADGSILYAVVEGAIHALPMDVLTAARARGIRSLTPYEAELYEFVPRAELDAYKSEWTRRETHKDAERVRDAMLAEHVLPSRVEPALRARTDIPAEVRDDALRILGGVHEPTLEVLVSRAHETIDEVRWQPPEAYHRALRSAQVAAELRPADVNVATTLGIAQVFSGLYADGLATLVRCDRETAPDGDRTRIVGFLAVALHRIGRVDEAKAQLTRLRELTTSAAHKDDAYAKWLLAEAERQIMGFEAAPQPRRKTDSATSLNGRAWGIVANPGAAGDLYDRALAWAQEAVGLKDGDIDILNTLGVAQYRCGKFVECVETLVRCDAEHSKSPAGAHPADVAFLAMAHQRLGHAADAKAALARLRELMAKPPHADSAESKAFLAEAVALIEGK